jgi:hypothetical protein
MGMGTDMMGSGDKGREKEKESGQTLMRVVNMRETGRIMVIKKDRAPIQPPTAGHFLVTGSGAS